MTEPRRKHWRRARLGLWILVVVTVASLGIGALGLALSGRYLTLPDFVTARIEARINASMPTGSAVKIAAIGLGIAARTLSPTVELRDVTLVDSKGDVQARLPRLHGQLDLASLLRGRIRPVSVIASGAMVRVRRGADGQLDIRLGDALTKKMGGNGIESVPAFLERLDTLFAIPMLAPLESVHANDLTIFYEDARSGRTFEARGGRVVLQQKSEAASVSLNFSLNGPDAAKTTNISMTLVTRKGSPQTDFKARVSNVAARDIAGQSPALDWLSVLDARLSASLTATINKTGHLERLDGTLDISKGNLRPEVTARPVPFNQARTYFSYDARHQRIAFSEIRVEAPALRAVASGQAYVVTSPKGNSTSYLAQFKVSEIRLDPKGIFKAPVVLPGGAVDLRLRLDPFRVDIGQLVVLLGEGNKLVVKGRVSAEPKGWRASLDLTASRLHHDQIMALWPLDAIPNTRLWAVNNFPVGTISKLSASLRMNPGQKPRGAATFRIDGASIRFMKFMPLLTGASGYGSFDGKSFTAAVEAGTVKAAAGGRVDAAGTSFTVADVFQKPAQARVALKVSGSLRAGMELLNLKPLYVMTKAHQPTDFATGQFKGQAQISLPLEKEDVPLTDVTYSATAELSSVRSDKVIKRHKLAADRLNLETDNTHVLISGQATLDGIPVAGEWNQDLGPKADHTGHVTGKMELSKRTADAFGILLPANALSGAASGNFSITLPRDKAPQMKLTSDLRGLRLALPALGWRKPAKAAGVLDVTASLGAPARIRKLLLKGGGLSASGRVTLRKGGALKLAQFPSVKIGGWFDGSIDLRGRGRGVPAEVVIKSGTLDYRQAHFGIGAQGRTARSIGGPPISASLDRLILSDGITLTGLRGKFTTSKGLDGTFVARVNGKAPIRGQIVPQGARSAVRITAADGGAVLASAGLFKSAHGGEFDLILLPAKAAGAFDGKLKMSTTRVKGANALAQLLSAISVIGLVEQLAGEGILFSDVEGSFHLTPAGITITQGAAVGASLGISMTGIIDLRKRLINMQGTVTPIYMFNGLVGALTGVVQREGLFGFSYRMTGPLGAPKVSVNPLSILAPGFLRRIFRRPIPKLGK